MRELQTSEIGSVAGGTGWLDHRVNDNGRSVDDPFGAPVIGLADPLGNAATGYLGNDGGAPWASAYLPSSDDAGDRLSSLEDRVADLEEQANASGNVALGTAVGSIAGAALCNSTGAGTVLLTLCTAAGGFMGGQLAQPDNSPSCANVGYLGDSFREGRISGC